MPARVAAIASAVLCAGAALAAIPAPVASAEPCPDIEVVFARGTSEPAGVGRVGQALADALRGQVGGRTVSTYAVNYPATYDFMAAADGATDATNHIAAMAESCPSTRIVLGGYSQGAAVVDMLLGIPPLGNRVGDIGSAPPLPGNLSNNIAAVAVFGNPSAKFGIPVTSSRFGGRAIDMCSDGDPICSDGRNPFAHTHYESSAFIPQAAGFIAGLV
ncbi:MULTISPECIES: cutinase family protein [Mycolicibacterium]|uniref:Cutinase n=1 Tax=Mycolicibacterium wolinskyi TaxID=59750 RepID=A0A132PU62_9MYCO|nr:MULTISPECIES: cutinase family protein [Mycolicibacterium]KWX25876.1 cutinase [Mycolicibacterium wolinskyi]MCV7288429.1 cutinase family protein [Mycolicibacterium wolinskyi]MCV7295651.1 cutinase family protein [Mycolicibacterium goodii]ORX11675.1 cutinase [Mycolicibacterium wolinskyi]